MKKFIFSLIICAGMASMVSCNRTAANGNNNKNISDTVKVDTLDSATVNTADSSVADSNVCND
jgi:lipoprotein